MNLLTTKIGRFKLIASLEGISFLLLVGIAVPLKYIWGQPWLVQNVGMIHGLLFVLYLFSIIQNKIELEWNTGKTLLAMLMSIVPFGTFYVVSKMIPAIMKEAANRSASLEPPVKTEG
jgi:integral membrane protein